MASYCTPDQVTIIIICLLYTFFLKLFCFYKLFWSLIPKNYGNVCHYTTFLDVTSSCFPSVVPCFKLLDVMSSQKQVTDVSLALKDSDMESENLSSLIQLPVLDGQKTDRSKVVSFIGI